jgi:hypothetical protein
MLEPIDPLQRTGKKEASSPTAEKKALVIGVSEYDHEDIQKLEFCKK